jgi:hypothetical protein
MISVTPRQMAAPDLDRLSADELLGALRDTARERDATIARRDGLAADLARRETEQHAALARATALWGSNADVAAPTGDREGERLRAALAATEARLPVIAAWRAAVCAALRRRIAREETALAEERAMIARDTASVAARQARARELWQPLAAYEGLPTGGPPIAGATQQLALELWSRRDQLARREQERARLAGALARAEQDD